MFGPSILRQFLPVSWSYGWKFHAAQAVVRVTCVSLLVYSGYVMFLKETPTTGPTSAVGYEVVIDPKTGRAIDIAYQPLHDAKTRARERSAEFSVRR